MQLALHQFGQPVSNEMSLRQLLTAAGAAWNLEKEEIRMKRGGTVPDLVALVRNTDRKYFGSAPPSWTPRQNSDVLSAYRTLCIERSLSMTLAGSLEDGRLIWMLAKLPRGEFSLFKNDRIEPYLFLCNSHTYGQSLRPVVIWVRVASASLMALAIDQKYGDDWPRACNDWAENVSMGKVVINIAMKKMAAIRERAELLASKRVSVTRVHDYVDGLYPPTGLATKERSQSARTIIEHLNDQPGVEHGQGTWWWAFNAVLYANNWQIGRGDEERMRSLLFRNAFYVNMKALASAG